MADKPHPGRYSGFLMLAGPDKGVGEIRDWYDWPISITAIKGERNGQPCLILSGVLGPTPPKLAQLDDVKVEEGA